MQVFDNIRKKIQIGFGRRGHVAAHSTGLVEDLINPSNLCLFFCAEKPEELNEIRSVLKQARANESSITVFIFHPGYTGLDVITDKSIVIFNLNDFTLFGRMRENLAQQIKSERFDLLISFVFKHDGFNRKLLSEINAKFKIGPQQDEMEGIYDLTINAKKELFTYQGFYKEVNHYLNKLNIRVKNTDG